MINLPPYLEQWYLHECGGSAELPNTLERSVANKMKRDIRTAFIVQLESELTAPSRRHRMQKDRIWDFMENHGIEFEISNWQAIDKIYQRHRISVIGHLLRAA